MMCYRDVLIVESSSVFFNAKGCLRASLNGKDSKRTQLAQLYFDFIDRTDWEEIYGIWSVATRVRVRRISEWRVERHSPNCLWSLVLCGKSIPNEKNSANYVNYINASFQ